MTPFEAKLKEISERAEKAALEEIADPRAPYGELVNHIAREALKVNE